MTILTLTPEQVEIIQNTDEEVCLSDGVNRLTGPIQRLPTDFRFPRQEVYQYLKQIISKELNASNEYLVEKLKQIAPSLDSNPENILTDFFNQQQTETIDTRSPE